MLGCINEFFQTEVSCKLGWIKVPTRPLPQQTAIRANVKSHHQARLCTKIQNRPVAIRCQVQSQDIVQGGITFRIQPVLKKYQYRLHVRPHRCNKKGQIHIQQAQRNAHVPLVHYIVQRICSRVLPQRLGNNRQRMQQHCLGLDNSRKLQLSELKLLR